MFLNLPLYLRLIPAMLSAAVCAYLLTPSVRSFAVAIKAVDVPGDARRVNDRAVPRMGGIAIFLGFLAALLVFSDASGPLAGVAAGAAVIALMGVADDVFCLRAPLKLAFQLIAALIAYRSGARIELISHPLGAAYIPLGELSLPLTVLWITACTNALNLIDGLDGLAAGVAAIGAISMMLVAAMVSEPEIAVFLAALAGACLGFIPFNRSPARIFMGDVGSQLLGYLLSAASVLGMFKAHALITFLVPLLSLALPLTDTAFAFVRRLARHKSPFTADRGHIHHRLLDAGMGQREAVAVLYSASAASGLCAVMLGARGRAAAAVCLPAFFTACGVMLAAIRKRALLSLRAKKTGGRPR